MEKKSKTLLSRLRDPMWKELILNNEASANLVISNALIAMSFITLIIWGLFLLKLYSASKILVHIGLLGGAILMMTCSVIVKRGKGKKTWYKYILFVEMEASILIISAFTGYKVWLMFSIPIIMSLRYYDIYFTSLIWAWETVLIVICNYLNAYGSGPIGVLDLNMVRFPVITDITANRWLYKAVLTSENYDARLVFDNGLRLMVFPNILLITLITIIGIMVLIHGQTLLREAKDASEREAQTRKDIENANMRVTISQIQPHFLYNTLSAIMAIDGNPDETVEAIGQFGKYLRENLNALSGKDLISFQDEMSHVMRYISLEQLRFGEKLHVTFELGDFNFQIPALTIQMLVENAVKHGITQKPNGGVIVVVSEEKQSEYTVTVEDDGVGFDYDEIFQNQSEERVHIGINNIRLRLKNLCNGTLEIESRLGMGTTATVHIPKKK